MRDITKIFKDHLLSSANERLEQKIINLLKKNSNPQQIFEKIKNHPDVEQVSRFLYNSGLDRTLLDFSIKRLEKEKTIAWPYILKLFIKYKIIPKPNFEKLLFRCWLKDKKHHSSALFACKEWSDISPEFQQLRFVYLQELEEKNLSEENDLLEQLEFVQAQNLIKEEEEIITKLMIIKPDHLGYKKLAKELKEKKALLTIQEQKKLIDKADRLADYAPSFDKNLLKKDWLKTVAETASKNPKHAKNLALFLYFCDCPNKALDVLAIHISKISDYWFYLDWALETKQYTKGLELINRFFLEVQESASFFLPLIYIKSQMLYALGKKSEAIEYFTAISQVQPDYKSTQYLLDKWLKNI